MNEEYNKKSGFSERDGEDFKDTIKIHQQSLQSQSE